MNTRMLMAGSAGVMAVVGLTLQFVPHEVLAALATPTAGLTPCWPKEPARST